MFQDCDDPETQSGPSNAKTGKAGPVSKYKKVRHWDKKSSKVALNLTQSVDDIDTSPVESLWVYFERVFPRSLVEHIVEQTNLYSQQYGGDELASHPKKFWVS